MEFFLYLGGCISFLYLTGKYRVSTLILSIIIAIIFPFVTDTTGWSSFLWIKYYSVIIPVILFSFSKCKAHFKHESLQQTFKIMPKVVHFFLALNLAEAAVYVYSLGNFIIALFGIILIITMPKFCYDEKEDIGFEDKWWVIGYTLCLAIGLFSYPQQSALLSSGIAILVVALLSCAFVRSWRNWISFRVYSLYYLIVLDGFFTRDGYSIYYEFNSDFFLLENRISQTSQALFSIISLSYCVFLLYRWKRETLLLQRFD